MWVAAGSAAMLEILQNLQTLRNNVAARLAAQIRYKAHTTSVALKCGVV